MSRDPCGDGRPDDLVSSGLPFVQPPRRERTMSRAKVLVVDDEPEIVQAVGMRLRARGYEVLSATDGVQATAMAVNQTPDVIILDIGMPAGNGHIVAGRLKENPKTSGIPVIFLTARTSERDYHRAFKEGVRKYITKPYVPEELMEAVEQYVEAADPA
jgi:two-component system, OmpR family, alkaline phosphatase synthesis response regulator PhoP